MIKEIRIRNFAIIENLAVSFEKGLNVLTGETGAGKSIIIDALNLLLGGRADTDSIRSGETNAFVEAVFEVTDLKTRDLILKSGIEMEEGELLVKRQISNTGKNRCLLNDFHPCKNRRPLGRLAWTTRSPDPASPRSSC
ncbi:AAA family ATPase [Nitrospinae bacterium]|nr:AAA family ATPase [Nitrospinota bacterium]